MLRALALSIAVIFTSPALAEDGLVKASNDSNLQVLSYVFGVHNLSDEKRGAIFRLFESGGGDPALNGNRLLLATLPDPSQEPRVWRSGIDVYIVRGVALDSEKGEISIDAIEHYRGDEGSVRERARIYTIEYDVDTESGAVSESIRVSSSPLK
jgi:hypothetical protein